MKFTREAAYSITTFILDFMKKFARPLLLAFFMVPVLSLSHVNAGDRGHGRDGDRRDGDRGDFGNGHTEVAVPPSVPLNGGIVLLLIAGVGLGVKLAIDANKARKQQNIYPS